MRSKMKRTTPETVGVATDADKARVREPVDTSAQRSTDEPHLVPASKPKLVSRRSSRCARLCRSALTRRRRVQDVFVKLAPISARRLRRIRSDWRRSCADGRGRVRPHRHGDLEHGHCGDRRRACARAGGPGARFAVAQPGLEGADVRDLGFASAIVRRSSSTTLSAVVSRRLQGGRFGADELMLIDTIVRTGRVRAPRARATPQHNGAPQAGSS